MDPELHSKHASELNELKDNANKIEGEVLVNWNEIRFK